MNQITKAIELATLHHKDMLRKGTAVPYLAHLFSVCKMLAERDCHEDLLAAALLHDVIEETPVTLDQIEQIFGSNVAFLVAGATEPYKLQKTSFDKVDTWKARKQHTVHFIETEATLEQMLIILADKIDNIQTIRGDIKRLGEEAVWQRFNAGKEEQQWYYAALLSAFKSRADISSPVFNELVQELELHVNTVFQFVLIN